MENPANSPRVALVANGEIRDCAATRAKLADADYFIACDGGLRHFAPLGLMPDMLIGDFDSASAALRAEYAHIPAFPFPAEKDDTDLALAVAHALAMRPASLTIVGALGGRFDHALANVHVLAQIAEAAQHRTAPLPAEIWDENTSIQLAHPFSCCEIFFPFPRENYATLSLVPLGERVTGITTRGLRYALESATLRAGETRGISNTFTADTAEISVESGRLLVIRAK